MKGIKVFLKKERKMKNKSWLTIYKNITKKKKKKHFSIITRNDFRFKNLGFVGVGLGHWTR